MTRISAKEAYSNRDLIAQIARLKTYVEKGTFKEVSTSYSGGVLTLTFTAYDDSTQSFNIPMDSIVGITGDQVGNTVTLHVEFASGTVVDIPYTFPNADVSPTPDTLGLRDGSGYLKALSPAVGVHDNNLANGTKVKDELDNYAPMVRTTGNQTVNGVKKQRTTVTGTYMIDRVPTTSALEILKIDNATAGVYLFHLIVSGRFDLFMLRVGVTIDGNGDVSTVTAAAQGIYALSNIRQIVAGARCNDGTLRLTLRAKSGNTSISAMPMNCNVDGLTKTMDLSPYGNITSLANMTGYVEEP